MVTSATRWALAGATLAVFVVAAAVGALVLTSRTDSGGTQSPAPTKVVVVFAMPGEDQAVTAQLIVTIDTLKGTYEVADPSAQVPVPGVSSPTLPDAYPFGGAEFVASALLEDDSEDAGWVDVSPEAWQAMLAGGFDATLTEGFQAFDNESEQYSEFDIGAQHVAVENLGGFVNGLPYTSTSSRIDGAQQLAKASLAALAKAKATDGIEFDLAGASWDEFAGALAKALSR